MSRMTRPDRERATELPTSCERCTCECRWIESHPAERDGEASLCTVEPMHPDRPGCSACDCECCVDDGCEGEDGTQ